MLNKYRAMKILDNGHENLCYVEGKVFGAIAVSKLIYLMTCVDIWR